MRTYKTLLASISFILLISVFSNVSATPLYNTTASKNFHSAFKAQQPIDIGFSVNGVKLDSIFFDKKTRQGFIILVNRTPAAVTTEIGVSIFDSKGKIIASGIDISGFSFSGDHIDPGEQKNVKLSFDKHLNDYSKAATFQLVFSMYEEIQTKSSGSTDISNDEDF